MLVLLSADEELNQRWLSYRKGGIERYFTYSEPHELLEVLDRQSIDHAVLSDRYFDFGSFCDYTESLRERQPNIRISVLLSDRHDRLLNERWMKTCLANGYFWISPHRTKEMIIQQLQEYMSGSPSVVHEPRSKLMVFVGSTPNIGTTLVSFGTAVELARATAHRVGYICLNLKSSKLHRYLGNERPTYTLDQLRAELRSQSLTRDKLLQACESLRGVPNMHVLFGNMLREQAEFYMPEDIAHLLKVARTTFEICIVEVNAYWDNAATLGGLLEADSKYLITTNELTHFQEDTNRWLNNLCHTFGIPPSGFDLIVNQSDRQSGTAVLRLKDIRRETAMNVLGQIHRHPSVVESMNQGKLLELLLGRHPVQKELFRITDAMIRYHQFERKPVQLDRSEGKSWFGNVRFWIEKGRSARWEA